MGLTKPRAAQIYNLDYKQATRVVTVSNITLAGGAPAQVDGVSLSVNDRILVTGQSTASQNGLYDVDSIGTGSNGTWVRTNDANNTGEVEAGMIVMVTEGSIYADTQWKLITDNPIIIGSTALTFTQNYSANSISGGTSNVTVYANANVTISSAGTSNVLTISSTGVVVSGTGSVTGNITGGNLHTGGKVSATGNIFTSGELIGLGNVSITGNILGNYIYSAGDISAIGNVLANGAIYTYGAINSETNIFAAGNITGGNLLTNGTISSTGNATHGNVLTVGQISATGNITGNCFIGNGSALTGIVATNVTKIANGTSNVTVIDSSNVTVGITGTTVATFATTGEYVTGIISATGNITSSGNINGVNLNSTGADLAELYLSDIKYSPGTVVEFGGEYEVTITNKSHSTAVAGIVSTAPGHLMNGALIGEHTVAVALTGRVPCQVVGTICKGDRLVSSGIPGVATALDATRYEPGCIVGKALENYNSINNGTIEVAVGRF
jgi:hypothetical protein